MKIRVGKRYLNGQGKVIYINYADKECFYGVADGVHGQLAYYKDGRRAGTLTDQSDLRLVEPYKPKRREPKVGDCVELCHGSRVTRGEITDLTKGGCFYASCWDTKRGFAEGLHEFHRRQIVRFLNKEKV